MATFQKVRCKAHSTRSGKQCKRWAILGGTVCITHGGKAPQVIAKAKQRLAALVDPALDALENVITDRDVKTVSPRVTASLGVCDRAGLGPSSSLAVSGDVVWKPVLDKRKGRVVAKTHKEEEGNQNEE